MASHLTWNETNSLIEPTGACLIRILVTALVSHTTTIPLATWAFFLVLLHA